MSPLRAAYTEHKPSLLLAVIASLTLGLAPFVPHAHIYKQLSNLFSGQLTEAMDIFDLVLHGAPWAYLVVVLVRMARTAARARRTPG